MKKFYSITALLTTIAIIFTFSGCKRKIQAENLMKEITPAQTISATNPDNVSAKVSNFALRLFKESYESGKNTLISPISVISALGLAQNGAAGNTLQQMQEALELSAEELNNFINYYNESCLKNDNVTSANSIWYNDKNSLTVKDEFLQKNADFYGADIYKSAFDDSTLKDINNWVKNKTNGRIDNMLGEIPPDAVMYLINALSFDAQWQSVYTKNQVHEGIFTTERGSEQSAEFMYSTEGKFIETENAKGFIKDYKGGKFAFATLLPNENTSLESVIKSLTGEKLKSALDNYKGTAVIASLPKFETEFSTEMSSDIQGMGITDAFDSEKADFSEMSKSEEGNIFISKVLHKSYISVFEKGTKAGAATVVEASDGASINEEQIYLDRPFLYMIIDTITNTPIFIGNLSSFDEESESEIKEEEIEFKANYIRTNGYQDGEQYPKSKVIMSRAELDGYINDNKNRYTFDRPYDESPAFIEHCNKYDNEFFEEYSLILALLEEPSGSIRHKVESITKKGDAFNVDIYTIEPTWGTDDMAQWHIISEVKKDTGISDTSNVTVNGENERISIRHGYGNIAIDKLKDWEYELIEYDEERDLFGIRFSPKGEQGKLSFYCSSHFGICGTDLETKKDYIGNHTVDIGTYDNDEIWSHIYFTDTCGKYFVLNDGVSGWWDEYGDTAMHLIETATIDSDVFLSQDDARELTLRYCPDEKFKNTDSIIRYDFDIITGEWCVNYFADDGERFSAYLDYYGNILDK